MLRTTLTDHLRHIDKSSLHEHVARMSNQPGNITMKAIKAVIIFASLIKLVDGFRDKRQEAVLIDYNTTTVAPKTLVARTYHYLLGEQKHNDEVISMILGTFSIISLLFIVLGVSWILMRRYGRAEEEEEIKRKYAIGSKTFRGYSWALRRKSSKYMIDIDKFVSDLKRSNSNIYNNNNNNLDVEAGKDQNQISKNPDPLNRKLSSSFWTLRLSRSGIFRSYEDDEANGKIEDFNQFNESLPVR